MTDHARWVANDLVLFCHLQPGAKRSEFAGLHAERIKIRVHAPPVDGKANSQLIAFLSAAFAVAKTPYTLKVVSSADKNAYALNNPIQSQI